MTYALILGLSTLGTLLAIWLIAEWSLRVQARQLREAAERQKKMLAEDLERWKKILSAS